MGIGGTAAFPACMYGWRALAQAGHASSLETVTDVLRGTTLRNAVPMIAANCGRMREQRIMNHAEQD